jgi:integrase
MQQQTNAASATARRPRGTGHLIVRTDAAGREAWFGKWRHGDRQVMRKLGGKRAPGSKIGLTRVQAEAELRRQIEATRHERQVVERVDVGEAGKRLLLHLETRGLKRSTLMDYESTLRVHLAPFFSGRSLDKIDARLVESFITSKLAQGRAPKSVSNYLGLLHSIFAFSSKRGWATTNPVADADKPRSRRGDGDIRFLTIEELEAVIRAVPDDELGPLDRVLYLCAAMSGMRRGELLALRWRDIDWANSVVRVRRAYTRGEFGTPKSRRSSRVVPLADRLAAELEQHYRRTRWQGDDDLVFAHPLSGRPYDPSRLRKRFAAAAARACARPVRFHDLRHTFGTQMAAAGAPLRMVQEWLGHSDYRTTSIYADYAPDATHGAAWAARAFAPAEDITGGSGVGVR